MLRCLAEQLAFAAEQAQLLHRPDARRQLDEVLVEPEPLRGLLPRRFHRGLRHAFEQHRHDGAQRKEGEERVEVDEDPRGDGRLQEQPGELQHGLKRPGRAEQAVAHQADVVGEIRPVQVVDARRAVHQGHELAAQPVLLQLRDLEVVKVREVAEHQLCDQQQRGEQRERQRRARPAGRAGCR